jgi:hypothetical protein
MAATATLSRFAGPFNVVAVDTKNSIAPNEGFGRHTLSSQQKLLSIVSSSITFGCVQGVWFQVLASLIETAAQETARIRPMRG